MLLLTKSLVTGAFTLGVAIAVSLSAKATVHEINRSDTVVHSSQDRMVQTIASAEMSGYPLSLPEALAIR